MHAFFTLFLLFPTKYALTIYWNATESLSQPLYNAAFGINADNTLLYIFNGLNSTNDYHYSPNIYKYDGTNTPQRIETNLNLSKYSIGGSWQSSTSINDMIYFTYYSTPIFCFNTSLEAFKPSIMKNEYDGNAYCLASNDTHLFYFGCSEGNDNERDCLRIYDIKNEIWYQNKQISFLHYDIAGASCGYYQNIFYIFGGIFCNASNASCDNIQGYIVKYYDTINIWNISDAELNYHPLYSQAILPRNDGIFYIFGGMSNNNIWNGKVFDIVNIFDANTETVLYDDAVPMLYGAVGMMSGYINERIYIFGGQKDGNNILSQGEMSNIITSNGSYPSNVPTNNPTKNPSIAPTVNNTGNNGKDSSLIEILVGIGCGCLVLIIIAMIRYIGRLKERNNTLHEQRLIDNSVQLDIQEDVNNVSITSFTEQAANDEEGENEPNRRDTADSH